MEVEMTKPMNESPKLRMQRGATFVKLTDKADKIYETPLSKNTTPYQKISKKELLRYIIYTVIFFVVISLQIDIGETSIQNSSIRRLYFPMYGQIGTSKSTNPFQDLFKNIHDIYISNHFTQNQPYGIRGLNFVVPTKMNHISDVRVILNNVKATKSGVNRYIWDKMMEEDKDSYGGENNTMFVYSERRGAFEQFVPILNATSENAEAKFIELNKYKFWSNRTRNIDFDSVYYNPNNMKVTYLKISMFYQPNGVTYEKLDIETFRLFLYESKVDTFRLVLEILYLLFYIYYLIAELIKIYSKIVNYNMNQNSSEEESGKKTISKQLIGKVSKLRNKALQILLGIKSHVSNIWTFLDVLLIICGGVAISIWFDFATTNSLLEQFPKVNYGTSDLNRTELHEINAMAKMFAEKITTYYKLVSVVALVQSLKILKTIISFSVRLSSLLQLIMNVMDYLLFYLILMLTVFLSFVMLVSNYYGQGIIEFSDFYKSSLYLLALMIGYNKKSEEMMQFDSNFSIFFFLIYYFIIIFILINFFLIIVKHEYQRMEEQTIKNSKKEKVHLDKFDYEPHFIVSIKEKIRGTLLEWSWYFSKSFYERKMHEEKAFNERLEIESINHCSLEFDVNFKDVCAKNELENVENFDDELISEHERLRRVRFRKIELVRVIWKTILLLILFVFFVSLIFYNFDVQNSFYGTQSINNFIKSSFDNSTTIYQKEKNFNIEMIKHRASLLFYFSGVFTQCFEKRYYVFDMPKFKQNFSQTGGSFNMTNVTLNLPYTFSINEFNLLLLNKVRISTRRLNIIEQNLAPFKKYFPTYTSSTFSYYNQLNANENKSDFSYNVTVGQEKITRTIKYSEYSGYGQYGAYTFFMQPDSNNSKSLIYDQLYKNGFLNDTLNSFVVDFALINPFHDGKIIYVILAFEADDNGGVSSVKYTYQFQANNVDSKFFISVTFMRVVVLIGYLILAMHFFKSLIFKLEAYDIWHNMYINSYLPQALLYHRNRKHPEFIRRFWFVFGTNNLLNLLFFLSCGVLLILTVLQEAYTFSLRNDSLIMGVRLYDLIGKEYTTTEPTTVSDDSLEHFLNTCYRITYINDIETIFASLSVFFLCFKLVFYLGRNQRFKVIIRAISFSFSDFPFILFLAFSFITAFAIFLNIYLGPNIDEFSNIIACYTNLVQNLNHMSPQLYSYFMAERDMLGMLIIFVVFFICVKFVILNLFFSVVYRSYQVAKKSKGLTGSENPDISVLEFFSITWRSIILSESRQKKKEIEVYLQSITRDDFKKFFEKMKDTIKFSKDNITPITWSNYCSEEIKTEQMNRLMISEKCDQIMKEYRDETNIGDFSFFKNLSKDVERKRIEYQIRLRYWNYFKIANSYLNKYDLYFKMKIQRLVATLVEEKVKQESDNSNEYYNMWIKFYVSQLEDRLESNFQEIYKLTSSKKETEDMMTD